MVDVKAWKDVTLSFAGKLVAAGWSAVKACALVGLHRTTWYRHLNPPVRAGISVPQADRAYPNRITPAESEEFMELLNSQDYGNLSVTQAYYRMLDKGHCSFSIAAAHRIVASHGQNGDRRAQRGGTGPARVKPVLEATAPNQLWSWDITMLHGPRKTHLQALHNHGRILAQGRRPSRRVHRIRSPGRNVNPERGGR
ncbi:hypothetical protein [Paenarthrobacter sp. 2TAF44]|uniref:hypothetical protein n=1 Tax=Paenarthrobacter sp. 2TAF44 TaxID=3233018 RepID=UPI003F97007C